MTAAITGAQPKPAPLSMRQRALQNHDKSCAAVPVMITVMAQGSMAAYMTTIRVA